MYSVMSKKTALLRWVESNDRVRRERRGMGGGGAVSELARKTGVSRQYMSRLVNGHARPGVALAKKISRATGGQVGVAALLGI